MTENNTTQNTTADVIKSLTAKGRDAMTEIGHGRVSFFDGGIVEGEGSWGGCLVDDLGHKSSGVLNRLRDLGLFTQTAADEQDDAQAGGWWTLTALGADVAQTLAKEPETPAETTVEKTAEKKETTVNATTEAKTEAKPETAKTPVKRVQYTPQGRITAKKQYTVSEAAEVMGMSANAMNHWFRRDYFPTQWVTREGSARRVRIVTGADLSTYVKTKAKA